MAVKPVIIDLTASEIDLSSPKKSIENEKDPLIPSKAEKDTLIPSKDQKDPLIPSKAPTRTITIADEPFTDSPSTEASTSKRTRHMLEPEDGVVIEAFKPPSPKKPLVEVIRAFRPSSFSSFDHFHQQRPEPTPVITRQAALPTPTTEDVKKCPICLDPLANASSTICGHIFCTDCIAAAVKAHQICPICRKKLNKKNAYHPIFM